MPNSRIKSRRSLVLSTIALCLASAGFVGWSNANSSDGNVVTTGNSDGREVRIVRTLTVEPRAMPVRNSAVGEIRPQRESDFAFRLSGKLVSRTVEVGAKVRKGDVLARLDDQEYRNRLRSAKADQQAAEAAVVEARASEVRIRRLLEHGYTTRANHDAALKNLRSTVAKLEAMTAAFDMAKDQLAYTELRADFDGIITAVGAEEGQVVNVGQMVARIANPANKDAVFSIAEAMFAAHPAERAGARITIALLSDPSVAVLGFVREVAPMADAATRTYQVKVALQNAPEAMRFGASVAGRVERPGDPVVTIPGSALFDLRGEPAVWVVGADDTVALKPIVVAHYEPDRVVVSDGLTKGDIVVTAGVSRLRDRQKVRIEGDGK
ncbi:MULTISPECIES: efflux RND transporter periplasmic adaptor subunit [Sinorhizobium]|uniref:Efflux transporter periplasmic adaptor subunit n=1 Tax=Sinorhizobium americanum TaxID=194963 RepID=A0A2S3YTI9_9HYPH|nr:MULTISPECIES: efflux RND transporter periplasmic adaptor subunit [Sinorhizobium]PDT37489.1 efflux transporter periplasmic adaptor subunit [Sinorhizobium sp. FG01]POH34905.1 efflux transporter periplasmic adaptor subunit [Sinorhizobium americanum]